MLLAKALLFLVLPLALVGAISYEEKSENIPPKSEIVFRIKRLLQLLRDRRKQDVEKVQQVEEPLTSRAMMDRRRRLEQVLRENPGLSALIKKSLDNRKEEEVRMLENDPRRRCRPGIFFCHRKQDADADSLKKLSKLDDEVSKRRRCRPGLFWCEKSDESAPWETDSQNQKKSVDLQKRKPKDDMKRERKQEVIDRLMGMLNKEKEDPQKRRRCRPGMFHCVQRDDSEEKKKVEIVRVPAADSSKKGEKLADDLMESLDNKNAKESDSPEKSSFDVKQLTKMLEGYKR